MMNLNATLKSTKRSPAYVPLQSRCCKMKQIPCLQTPRVIHADMSGFGVPKWFNHYKCKCKRPMGMKAGSVVQFLEL